MSHEKVSVVRNQSGGVVGKDTTISHSNGTTCVIHQKADTNCLGQTRAYEITGVTEHRPDGTSKDRPSKSSWW